MKILRGFILVCFLFGSFGLTGCGKGCSKDASTPDCKSADVFCIGLVTDVGTVDDKSFNQSTWEGVQLAVAELGAVGDYIETRDAKDYMTNIVMFAEKGYDIIVTVGFGLGEATQQAAGRYTNIRFIGVDQFQSKVVENVSGLIFREEHGGFAAGALAALLSKSKTIAAVMGTNLVPPVVAFKKGYEAGAKHIDPKIKVISSFHPGGLDVAFLDPEWGASTAKQAIDQGADVIFAAGGTTGNGGLVEVASHKGKYCIGVDTDQWQTLPEARGCLVSSAEKRINTSIYALIQMSRNGAFPAGNFYGDVGLAPFHDFEDKIPARVKNTLKDIDIGLRNGTIKVKP